MNILITNVGRRGYLVEYIKELPDMDGKVFVSDCDITASGLYGNNDGYFILPKPVDDEKIYVESLVKVCHENKISVVIPVIDPEIYILSSYKEFLRKAEITVVVSDKNVLDICYDKLKMNRFLAENNIHFPKTYRTLDDFFAGIDDNEITFPVVLKPIYGSGSVDTYFVQDKNAAKVLFKKGMMIQEKITGIEYGADVFNSLAGEPLRYVIKKKISMRGGETDKSISVHDDRISNILLNLSRTLQHVGNLDVDIIVNDNDVYVIDLNPRFGGGYPATHAIGVNLIDILYRLLKGEKIMPSFGNYRDDVLVMKEIAIKTTVMGKN